MPCRPETMGAQCSKDRGRAANRVRISCRMFDYFTGCSHWRNENQAASVYNGSGGTRKIRRLGIAATSECGHRFCFVFRAHFKRLAGTEEKTKTGRKQKAPRLAAGERMINRPLIGQHPMRLFANDLRGRKHFFLRTPGEPLRRCARITTRQRRQPRIIIAFMQNEPRE